MDKNNPNLRFSRKASENNNNNIVTTNSNSNGDNYNSNFTFNNVISQPNLTSENCLTSPNKNKQKKSCDVNSPNYKNNNLEEISEDTNFKININNYPQEELIQNQNNTFLLKNYFSKKNYAFILFELNNFCFTQKEYFKNIYPEINLVMVLELNDCILSQEKIFFYRTTDDNLNNIYYPFLKKEDLKYNKYRIIKPIEMNDEDFPIKISINFYTYTNYKMLPIGNEEIFLTLKKDKELQKFNFYHNVHLKYVNKKVGNTFFNLAYKIEEIYPNQLLEEINKNLECLSVNFFLILFIMIVIY